MKKALVICVQFIASVVIGLIWHFLIVPFLFYNTFASSVMKGRMRGDPIEFYGMAQEIVLYAKKGFAPTLAEKICTIFAAVGIHGVWIFPLLGILLGIRHLLSQKNYSEDKLIKSKNQMNANAENTTLG